MQEPTPYFNIFLQLRAHGHVRCTVLITNHFTRTTHTIRGLHGKDQTFIDSHADFELCAPRVQSDPRSVLYMVSDLSRVQHSLHQ